MSERNYEEPETIAPTEGWSNANDQAADLNRDPGPTHYQKPATEVLSGAKEPTPRSDKPNPTVLPNPHYH